MFFPGAQQQVAAVLYSTGKHNSSMKVFFLFYFLVFHAKRLWDHLVYVPFTFKLKPNVRLTCCRMSQFVLEIQRLTVADLLHSLVAHQGWGTEACKGERSLQGGAAETLQQGSGW